MSFLPVAERELYVRARHPATYRRRLVFIALGVLLLLLIFVGNAWRPASAGAQIFAVFSFLAACYCFIEGLRLTADCISSEVREGTIGLLFLTRLNAFDILAGKFVSAGLASFYGLLALLPVAFVPLLMGGVTGAEAVRMAFFLVNLLFVSLAVGLLVSCWIRGQTDALVVALFLMLAFALVPLLLNRLAAGTLPWVLESLSPFATYTAARSSTPLGHEKFWTGLLGSNLVAWILLWLAGHKLKRWREATSSPIPFIKTGLRGLQRRSRPGDEPMRTRTAEARQLLELQPAGWLARFTLGDRAALWCTTIIGMAFMLMFRNEMAKESSIAMVVVGIFNTVFKFLMALSAARVFAEARRDGQFELLLSTPISASKLVAAYHQELTNFFLAPLGAWCLVSTLMPLFGTDGGHLLDRLVTCGVIGIFHAMLALDGRSIFLMSLWLGATTTKVAPSAMRVVFWVVVLPWLMAIPCSGFSMAFSPIWTLAVYDAAKVHLADGLAMVARDPLNTKYERVMGFLWERAPNPQS